MALTMHPHSYAVDSLSKSQELASAILSASSPPQISAACASTASFLRSHSPEHSRHFFSLAFPALISKLFGFEESCAASQSVGWIDFSAASKDADLVGRIYDLLAPGGPLLASISAVDRLDLVKYVFPAERLPEWARFLLSSEKDRKVVSDLCPIFKNRVKEDSIKGSISQVQLNVFEYYMFWLAYYPVCRGNNENSVNLRVKRNRKFKLESWVSSISGFSSGVTQSHRNGKVECNLYVRLLYAYLQAFVPVSDLNSHQPYRSSLLHLSLNYDGKVMVQAEFLVNAFVHFWLVDNDFSPLPSDLCKSFGVVVPFRSVLGETPPTAGLGEVVKLFVKYLNLSSAMRGDGNESVDYNGSPMWRTSRTPGSFEGLKSRSVMVASPVVHSIGSWNLAIQRPLYRFILRTFMFCPIGTSMKNASEVFSVWIMYLEPWKISLDDLLDLESSVNESAKTATHEALPSQDCGYSPCWQGYVLSNYLYYSSLVMHFIGFAHKFLHADVEIIVQMVSKVMSVLTSSKELVDLIRMVDSVFQAKQAGSGKPMHNSLCRYVPSIREQLKDWEEGLSETDADGSFLHENWNKDLRLFSDGEDGGQQLLQLFILRAEAELQAISGNNLAQNLHCIDSLKAEVSCLFGSNTVKRLSFSPESKHHQQPRDEIFKPRRVGNHVSENTKYKGDWMKRPISNDEVAWLAKLSVLLSDWLNENLGLNHPEDSQVGLWSYIDVSSTNLNNVCGPKDTTKVVLCALGSWFLMLGMTVVKLMRRHGLRVNLRILASKKVVMVLLSYVVFYMLRRAFRHLHRV